MSGFHPLHWAVLQGDIGALDALLVAKAKPTVKTTAMVTSVPRARDARIFRPASGTFYPPDSNAEIGLNRSFDKGSTALHLAASIGDLEAVSVLLTHRARPTKDGVGATPLHLAALGGHCAVVERLLQTKNAVNAVTKIRKSIRFYDVGTTPLMAALESGSVAVVRLLLAHGADPQMRTKAGFGALIFAARGGCVEALDLMVDAGVSVTEPPSFMNFPLEAAAERGHLDCVKRLLALGAPSATPTGNQSPLRIAIKKGDLVMRQALLDGGALPLPDHGIESAIRDGDECYLREYLAKGGDPDAAQTGTHLWTAAALGFLPLVDVLLKAGADVNAHCGKGTALAVAFSNEHLTVADRLLVESPDCTITNEHGNTVLWAALRGSDLRIKRVLECGASPHSTNRVGVSPMSHARAQGNTHLIELFSACDAAHAVDRSWHAPTVSKVLQATSEGYSWKAVHAALWDELVPPRNAAPTVQGELVRCIGRLTDEAYRNGNCNWGSLQLSMVKYLEDTLLDGTFDAVDAAVLKTQIGQLRHHRSPDLSGDGSPHYAVSKAVVTWCLAHRELRLHPG